MGKLTYAVCTFNRCKNLETLLPAMRAQRCSLPFEILVVDNNSTDNTRETVERFASQPGIPIRYVHEPVQGIAYARNRAIKESLTSDFMLFIDDDEIPLTGLLEAAVDALVNEGAECVGGRVDVEFGDVSRPTWLDDELAGFLAEIDHGDQAFWIKDRSYPVWTANVGYAIRIFKEDSELRFDSRYNRRGSEIGGGEDAAMFWQLLEKEISIRYRPDMVVKHFVEPWRLKRSYFLKLHFVAGRKYGQLDPQQSPRTVCGVPLFLVRQAATQWGRLAFSALLRRPKLLRQAMNAMHASGAIYGRFRRWRFGTHNPQ